MQQTPYSIIKRYDPPYGKPWFPQVWHAYEHGKFPAGCGHEVEVGPITEQQSWMRKAEAVYALMMHTYREADKDWPWPVEPVQLDMFAA